MTTTDPTTADLLRIQADHLDTITGEDTAEGTARTVAALTHLLAIGRAKLDDLKTALHDQLPDDETLVVDGVGGFTRSWTSDSTSWDNDALRRWILDSRLVDKETGEVIDETPLDKILACYTFPASRAPSVSALKKRGITDEELDEFRTRTGKRPTVKVEKA